MKIAMLGLKGIPAKWGGIEKYIEEVATRLATMGHDVTVFGSGWYCKDFEGNQYKGVKIIKLPSIHLQATDALTNAFFATLSSASKKFDVVNLHGYASYLYLPFFKAYGAKVVVTPHGVESGWDNSKYGSIGQLLLKKAFKFGIKNADSVVTVAKHLSSNIKKNYEVDAAVIYSGLDQTTEAPVELIKQKYDLKGKDYIFFIGRIDPIKRVHWLLELSEFLPEGIKLVIAGGAQDSSTKKYLDNLVNLSIKNRSIIFTGPVVGKEKEELFSNCLCVLVPSKYEGLPITILEAASYRKCCIASSIPAHLEIIENEVNGFLFSNMDKQDFFCITQNLLNGSPDLLKETGRSVKKMTEKIFNWDKTAFMYSELFRRLVDE